MAQIRGKAMVVAPHGMRIDGEVATWITDALELRIGPRGNDADEAVDEIVAMVRVFAAERAMSIAIARKQKTVQREMREDRSAARCDKHMAKIMGHR